MEKVLIALALLAAVSVAFAAQAGLCPFCLF
jgi:hypothetical protein